MAGKLFAQVESLLQSGGSKLPPVQSWHPPFSGDIDIHIARDGNWYHEGAPMTRAAIVRLFASILRREGDEYFLVTPVEKWRIRVEDVPFIAVDVEAMGEGVDAELVFRTNVGDLVHANALHPLRVQTDPVSGAPSPYVMVRHGLEARIARSVFYRLVESAEAVGADEGTLYGVHSGGLFHPLGAG